jgi:hypothetical protein
MYRSTASQALAALSFFVLSYTQSALAAPSTLNCRHLEGERLLDTEVKVERTGTGVTITSTERAPDAWTYRILYEHPGVGFRAVRAGSTAATGQSLDVEYGGELFLTTQHGEPRLLVTAVDVARSKVSSQLLSCRDAR